MSQDDGKRCQCLTMTMQPFTRCFLGQQPSQSLLLYQGGAMLSLIDLCLISTESGSSRTYLWQLQRMDYCSISITHFLVFMPQDQLVPRILRCDRVSATFLSNFAVTIQEGQMEQLLMQLTRHHSFAILKAARLAALSTFLACSEHTL